MQKARRHHTQWLRPLVCDWFQVLFTPFIRVLFTFPSRYLFTIGLLVIFSLSRWCWQFHTGFHRPRATQDTARFNSSFVYGTLTLFGLPSQIVPLKLLVPHCSPTTPYSRKVWAVPRSLATTQGITIVFYSSRYLDVSVPWVTTLSRAWSSTMRVPPFGHLRINGYLLLPVAFRSLSRPSSSLEAQASANRTYLLSTLFRD